MCIIWNNQYFIEECMTVGMSDGNIGKSEIVKSELITKLGNRIILYSDSDF